MAEAAVELQQDGTVALTGDLVFATVGGLLEAGIPIVRQQPRAVVDLSAVARCDSAGLALLLEWVAFASAQGGGLKFRSLPEALLAIARLSNAETLLATA